MEQLVDVLRCSRPSLPVRRRGPLAAIFWCYIYMLEIMHEGVVERITQHEVQPSAVFALETTTECIIPRIAQKNRS